MTARRDQRLSEAERLQLAEAGYVVRESVFDAAELERIAAACEALLDRIVARQSGAEKIRMGSYLFQTDAEAGTVIKWEKDRDDLVLGVEPFAHLDDTVLASAMDRRFVEPMKDVVGAEAVCLYTEKLNVKRARAGGPIALHQDYPYWQDLAQDVDRVATAILLLDDATRDNGCLEVAPASHLGGVRPRKQSRGFGKNEMDESHFDLAELQALELPAGSLVMFGPLLVHRSLPNQSDADRRMLLYSYQPAGLPHSRELLVEKGIFKGDRPLADGSDH